MIRMIFLGVAAAAAVAGPATAQNCFFDAYGRIVCMPTRQYQNPYQPRYRGGWTREPGPVIDLGDGCEGGSCVNLGPGWR
jgi:hypothetical protein